MPDTFGHLEWNHLSRFLGGDEFDYDTPMKPEVMVEAEEEKEDPPTAEYDEDQVPDE
jgi:hypothetical protein